MPEKSVFTFQFYDFFFWLVFLDQTEVPAGFGAFTRGGVTSLRNGAASLAEWLREYDPADVTTAVAYVRFDKETADELEPTNADIIASEESASHELRSASPPTEQRPPGRQRAHAAVQLSAREATYG